MPTRRTLLTTLAVLACLLGLTPTTGVLAQVDAPDDQATEPVLDGRFEGAENGGTTRVIVALDVAAEPEADLDGADVADQRAELDRAQAGVASLDGVELVHAYEILPGFVAEVDADGLAALEDDPRVTAVTEDVAETADLVSSVPVTDAADAWAGGHTGEGTTVAVMDSGIDSSHSAIGAGRVVYEACFSTTASSLTSSCANGGPTMFGAGSGVPCTDTGCDHGTHVAATVSSGTVDVAGSGIAPGADLLAIQVFGNNSAGNTSAFISDQEAALEHLLTIADDHDLAAVNMSLGAGSYSSQAACDASNPTRAAAIANLRAAGVAVVISSGNSGLTSSMGRPGCFTSAISVGATEDDDDVAGFSNNASFLTLLAPGVDVCAPVPAGFFGDNSCGTNTDVKSGTSMAAPHVAGGFAVLQGQLADAGIPRSGPNVEALLDRIEASGVPVTDTRSGAGNNVTPRLDLGAAVDALSGTITADGTGDPIEDAWVIGVDISTGSMRGTATDAAGDFDLDLVGDRLLQVLDPSTEHDGEWWPGVPLQQLGSASLLEIGAAGADADLGLALASGGVAGTVTEDGTGDPVADAWVVALPTDSFRLAAGTTTDASGDYELTGLPVGEHVLAFIDPAGTHAFEYSGDTASLATSFSSPVAVASATTTTADAALAPKAAPGTGGTVEGTVTTDGSGTPVVGAWVLATGTAGGPTAGAVTDGAGDYSLDLPPDDYLVQVLDPAALHDPEWFDDHPSTDIASADQVTLGAAQTVEVDAALTQRAGTLAGTVTVDGGATPVDGAWVAAISSTGRFAGGAVTDASGDYELDGLAAGTYFVAFVDPSGAHDFEYHPDAPDIGAATLVGVLGGATTDLDAALVSA